MLLRVRSRLCWVALSLLYCCYADAQVGSLDSSFNGNGILIETSDESVGLNAIQPDGNILSGWQYYDEAANRIYVKITRRKPSAALDSSFGNNGSISVDFGSSYESFQLIRMSPDEKLLVLTSMDNDQYALSRFFRDGKIDSSFNQGGKLVLPFTMPNQIFRSMYVQRDGKIVLGGSYVFDDHSSGFLIARINQDGSADSSFGSAGVTHTIFSSHITSDALVYTDNASVNKLVIQDDGKIIAAGITTTNLNGYNADSIAIARFNTDGSLDNSFNKNGKITINPPNIETPNSPDYGTVATTAALQPDGKILIGGNFSYSQSHGRWFFGDFGIIRFNPDGTLDQSFNSNGIKAIKPQGTTNECVKIALQNDGKILMAGNTGDIDFMNSRAAFVRLNKDGINDTSFGQNGILLPIIPGDSDVVRRSSINTMETMDQRIYISGGYQYTAAVMVFKNNGSSLQTAYIFTGNGDWSNPVNWRNNVMPPPVLQAGSTIIIDPAPGGDCRLDIPYSITNGNVLVIRNGKRFSVNGNLELLQHYGTTAGKHQ